MTVQELIDDLSNLNPDLEIVVTDQQGTVLDIVNVNVGLYKDFDNNVYEYVLETETLSDGLYEVDQDEDDDVE